MNIELKYLEVLKQLLHLSNEPHRLKPERTGTGTYGQFGTFFEHDMKLGFPLLTTKKVHFKSIVTELLWFMRGQTDLKTLLKDKNTIWVGDAYKKYLRTPGMIELSEDAFINKILEDEDFSRTWGQLGPIYGAQWRGYDIEKNPDLVEYIVNGSEKYGKKSIPALNFEDQLSDAIHQLRTNPYNRRILVDSWNSNAMPLMTLPPCHVLYQFYVDPMSNQEKKANPGYHQKLSLMWYQRSADTFLGVPFNIASYGLLLELVARMVPGTKADMLKGCLGDTHLYSNHLDAARLQISRQPLELAKIQIDTESIDFSGSLDEILSQINDPMVQIQLDGYTSHSVIKAPLSN